MYRVSFKNITLTFKYHEGHSKGQIQRYHFFVKEKSRKLPRDLHEQDLVGPISCWMVPTFFWASLATWGKI